MSLASYMPAQQVSQHGSLATRTTLKFVIISNKDSLFLCVFPIKNNSDRSVLFGSLVIGLFLVSAFVYPIRTLVDPFVCYCYISSSSKLLPRHISFHYLCCINSLERWADVVLSYIIVCGHRQMESTSWEAVKFDLVVAYQATIKSPYM